MLLSEVCGRFKSVFAQFRHAAPRNQHPRSRVSSRRLREIDPRLGGSSAAAPDEYGMAVQYLARGRNATSPGSIRRRDTTGMPRRDARVMQVMQV